MASSATLPLACLVSPKLPLPIRQQRTFSGTDGDIHSSSLPPELSSNDFNRLRITRQSSEGTKKLPLRLHRGRLPIGSHRRTTDSPLERKASAQKVESSFARIRHQLAQSAEEYKVLQERLEKLNEGINKLRIWACKTNFQRKSWQVAPAISVHGHRGVVSNVIVSRSRGNLLLPLQSTWEGGEEKRKLTNSCTESSGPTSDYCMGTHVSQGAFEFVIKCEQEHSPLSSEAEDDVFN